MRVFLLSLAAICLLAGILLYSQWGETATVAEEQGYGTSPNIIWRVTPTGAAAMPTQPPPSP